MRLDRALAFGLAALLIVAGCAGPGAAPASEDAPDRPEPDGPVALSDYARDIRPFEVRDAEGEPYGYPFLGGLNTPRPQFVDINGNGRLDLFVQEVTNRLMFFENVGDGEGGDRLVWRTDRYQDLEVGEWFRFVDVDSDQQLDLLAEAPYSYIRYYRNTGTREEPAFTLAADTLRDVSGEPIFSDRQNIPNVADIDCDGLVDLFLGRLDGTISRYKSTGSDAQGVPQFEFITDRFGGIEIIGEFGQTGGLRHGANSMTFEDHDGDGVIDLFFGDFFEPSLLLIENQGRCGAPNFFTEPETFPPNDPVETSGFNAPAMADWTGNGVKDLFVGVLGGAYDPNTTLVDNFLFYEALDEDRYELRTRRFLYSIDVGSESTAALADLTGNGALDLLLANKIEPYERQTSGVYFFENTGTPAEPSFQLRGRLDLPDVHHYAPALGDLDGDGRPDLVVGNWRGELHVFRNEGPGEDGIPRFAEDEALQLELPRGSNASPTLIDLDSDGLLDIVSGASDGRVHFFRNEGTAEAPEFGLVEDGLAEVKVPRRSAPAFADLDGGGVPDLFVGTQDGELVRFENTGTSGNPQFDAAGEPVDLQLPRYATPVFAELYDGAPPVLLSGGREGGLVYFAPR